MKIMSKILICFSFCFILSSNAKVLLFTYSYNRPDFIEIQYKTFKKFLLDEYEFIVFNDATDPHLCTEIEQICKTLGIRCITIPQEIHNCEYNASVRNCNVVQYSLDTVGYAHDDIVALIDSDMFLIKPFSIREYMNRFDVAGWPQKRDNIDYLWIGLVFLNMKTMPNNNTISFNCGWIGNTLVDSGGFSYYYINNNPEAKIRYFEDLYYIKDFFCTACMQNQLEKCEHEIERMQSISFSDALIDLATKSPNSIMEVYIKNTFLHYRAGSNWNYESAEYHQRKTMILNCFMEKLLNE